MTSYNNRSSYNYSNSNFSDSCCNGNTLCTFNGNLDDVVCVPIYVQSVYDAVQFNLQGMKTIQNQTFSPAIPCGFTVSRVADIRTRSFFNPCNADDSRNLTVELDTNLSGATFVQDCHGNPITVVGPDGLSSQKILYPDVNCCDDDCMGTSVFGTQNVIISGDIQVFVDLILCDNCNRETKFTVCATVNVASESRPMCLTNFFEICMPASTEHAFLPRFTELSSVSSNVRLATNNCGRDITIDSNGELRANLILSICINAEKSVVAPAQISVLSTGMAEVPAQTNSGCNGFPTTFASGITAADTSERCGCNDTYDYDNDCGYGTEYSRDNNYSHGSNYSRDNNYSHGSNYSRDDDCGCGTGYDRDRDRDRDNGCGYGTDYDRDRNRDNSCGCSSDYDHR